MVIDKASAGLGRLLLWWIKGLKPVVVKGFGEHSSRFDVFTSVFSSPLASERSVHVHRTMQPTGATTGAPHDFVRLMLRTSLHAICTSMF